MSDNRRRYRAIREALIQDYPGPISGRRAQHLTILAALISGIVASKSSQLPHIAAKIPDHTQVESRIKRLSRWLKNQHVKEEVYFLPYAERLLAHLSLETLVLVMDGSAVGRGCCALMIHVLYQGRALPLAWRVRQGPKGHFTEELHISLVELIQDLIPEGTSVIFLGDGEFDGVELQATLNQFGWFYACRTSKSRVMNWRDIYFDLSFLGDSIKPGQLIELKEAHITRNAYGPVLVLCCWERGNEGPLYLVSNLSSAAEAIYYYKKRFRIETFFSDQKSRGFNLHKSHIEDPQSLSRLLMGSCLAYIWIIYLGSLAKRENLQSLIHRRSRCDLSLFRLGLHLLDHFLNEGFAIPVQFHLRV